MKMRIGLFVLGLCSLFLAMAGPVDAQKVKLKLQFPEGRKARYKNSTSFEYFSDRAELILMSDGGSLRARIDGEWRSHEDVVKPEPDPPSEKIEPGVVGIRAQIRKGDSRAIFLGERQTYEQFPYTLDRLNDRDFSWRISPAGEVHEFQPEFRAYRVERQDMVTDMFLAWMPEFCPSFPEEPVGEGDTWTGERKFERPFATMDWLGKKATLAFKSTYRIKKIKEKKGRIEVSIAEEREVTGFTGWIEVSAASLLMEGTGVGTGEWVIDATRGLVLSHKAHMNIDQPVVTKLGGRSPLADIRAEVNLHFERKLEKLEKE